MQYILIKLIFLTKVELDEKQNIFFQEIKYFQLKNNIFQRFPFLSIQSTGTEVNFKVQDIFPKLKISENFSKVSNY